MIHNITINQLPVTIEYSEIIQESDAIIARGTGNGIPLNGKITVAKSENFFEVFDLLTFKADFRTANMIILYNHYLILPDNSIKNLGAKTRGVIVSEFVYFMSNPFPVSFSKLSNINAVNMILQKHYGDTNNDYFIHAFNQTTLAEIQPICFDLTTMNSSIIVDVTDSTGNCVYSLDNENYQDSNEFLNLPAGNYTIFVKDSTDLINQKKITISDI